MIEGEPGSTVADCQTRLSLRAVADPVLQTVPLGFQWATVDPFLFCVHHLDRYPEGNEHMGPAASLDARDLGMDFAGADGWRMYHGSVVPGFPQHPHRGFETVTFVRQGFIDHSDSLGATARFGRGDVQWLTAGEGIVHCEMFPLLDREGPNPCELFQIWLNLPAADKMVEPYFTMLWDDDIPRERFTDADGRATEITVIAGRSGRSRAARAAARLVGVAARGRPRDLARGVRAEGRGGAAARGRRRHGAHALRLRGLGAHRRPRPRGVDRRRARVADEPVVVTGGPYGAEALVLQGRPIGEPVAQYGPFVMNDEAGIEQAFADYRRTGFGGWPWPTDDPVHPREAGRFARHADGRLEVPSGEHSAEGVAPVGADSP